MKRRKFIFDLSMGAGAAFLPETLLSFNTSIFKNLQNISFGIIADVHKDLMPDADLRLEKFINKAINRGVDFIIQLGDFCMADVKNKGFLEIW